MLAAASAFSLGVICVDLKPLGNTPGSGKPRAAWVPGEERQGPANKAGFTLFGDIMPLVIALLQASPSLSDAKGGFLRLARCSRDP